MEVTDVIAGHSVTVTDSSPRNDINPGDEQQCILSKLRQRRNLLSWIAATKLGVREAADSSLNFIESNTQLSSYNEKLEFKKLSKKVTNQNSGAFKRKQSNDPNASYNGRRSSLYNTVTSLHQTVVRDTALNDVAAKPVLTKQTSTTVIPKSCSDRAKKKKTRKAIASNSKQQFGSTSVPMEMEDSSYASFAIQQKKELMLRLTKLGYCAYYQKTLLMPTDSIHVSKPNLASSVLNRKAPSINNAQYPQQPPRLPKRKRSHWDSILDEMRSLSTDFVSERKWKKSCAKMMGIMLEQKEETLKKTPVRSVIPVSTAVSPMAATLLKQLIPACETESPTVRSMKNQHPLTTSPLYYDANTQDSVFSRQISRSLAVTISDYWHSILEGDACDLGDKRYQVMHSNGQCLGSHAKVMNAIPPFIIKKWSFEDITEKIGFLLEAIDALKKSIGGSKESINSSKHAIEFGQTLWQSERNCLSAMLGGDFGTGKTGVACSLMKQKSEGRHLVLCSPGSLFRWNEELVKHEMKVSTISNRPIGGDVLLLDYRSFLEILNTDYVAQLDLTTLCIDLRCNSDSNGEEIFELWDAITKYLQHYPTIDRLIIEPSVDSRNSKEGKLHTKILAMKIAFIFHPLFSGGIVGKRVVSWVKDQRAALDCLLKLNHSNYISVDLFERISNEIMDHVRFVIHSKTDDELKWELCVSPSTIEQNIEKNLQPPVQLDYELSQGKSDTNAELRKVCCFYCGFDDEVKTCLWRSLFFQSSMLEPNADAAKRLIKKSAKLKELLALLMEGGVDIAREVMDELPNKFCNEICEHNAATDKRRLLILGSLQESRLLTSFFLSCVGVRHELLDSTSFSLDSWDRIQTSLSLFNKIGVNCKAREVIISSPVSISSLSGGICPTSADTVVSVNDDWDDDRSLHFTSLAKKIRCSKQNTDACKFVKLICEDMHKAGLNHGMTDQSSSCFRMRNGFDVNSVTYMGKDESVFVNSQIERPAFHYIKTENQGLATDGSNCWKANSEANLESMFNITPKSRPAPIQLPTSDSSTHTTVQKYAQSISFTLARQSCKQAHNCSGSSNPTTRGTTKLETDRTVRITTELTCAPHVKSLLIYNIPVETSIDQPQKSFKSAVDLDKAFGYSCGYQPLIFLPPMFSNSSRFKSAENLASIIDINANVNFNCAHDLVKMHSLNWPSTESIILVSHKLHTRWTNSYISGISSLTNSPQPNTSLAVPKEEGQYLYNSFQDKCISSILDKNRPFRKSIAIREAICSNLVALVTFSIGVQSWLAEVLPDWQHCSIQPNLIQTMVLDKKKYAPYLYGMAAKQHTEAIEKERQRVPPERKNCSDRKLLRLSIRQHGMDLELATSSGENSLNCQINTTVLDNLAHIDILCLADKGKTSSSRTDGFIHRNISQSTHPEKQQQQRRLYETELWIQSSTSVLNRSQSTNSHNACEAAASLKQASMEASVMLAPVHTTHSDTVQTATPNITSLRTDLWPLEFIDDKDKTENASNTEQHEGLPRIYQHAATPHAPSHYNGSHNPSQMNARHQQPAPIQGAQNYEMLPSLHRNRASPHRRHEL